MFSLHYWRAGPGGHLVVRDCDLIMYNHEHPQPPEGQEPDAAAYMQGTSILANINRILTGGALRKGFVVGYAFLPHYYAKASHRVIDYLITSSKCLELLPYTPFPHGVSTSLLEITVIST